MRVALALALSALCGCVVEVDYGGTSFTCSQDPVCPPGFECRDSACVPEGSASDAAPDAIGGALRHQLEVTATLAETASAAPVLVRLTAERVDYQRAGDGADLRFVDDVGAALAHEIERWSPGGESIVWVKLPALATGARFFMIYGDGDTAAGQQRAAEVWSDHELVFHFDAGGGESRQGLEASLENGAMIGGGRLGGGAVLDGVDDHLVVGQDLSLVRAASAATISAWINADTLGGSLLEVAINGGTSSRVFANVSGAGGPQLGVRTQDAAGASLNVTGSPAVAAGTWAWVLGTADFAAQTITVYVDGVEVGSASMLAFDPTTPDTTSSIAVIGIDEGLAVGQFDGAIDEVRLSARAASAAEVAAQHLSMTDALLDYGPAETLP